MSVAGASAVAVNPLRVLRRHKPFGRLTVPGLMALVTLSSQWTSPELVEDSHEILVRQPACRRIVRMHRQLHVGSRQFSESRTDGAIARRRD